MFERGCAVCYSSMNLHTRDRAEHVEESEPIVGGFFSGPCVLDIVSRAGDASKPQIDHVRSNGKPGIFGRESAVRRVRIRFRCTRRYRPVTKSHRADSHWRQSRYYAQIAVDFNLT